jgi:hypothetical protein
MRTAKRKSKFVYDTGYCFDKKLAENIEDIYFRVKKTNKGGAIIIDGGIGEGKTTLGIHVGDLINKLDGKAPIVINKKDGFQIGMGGVAFIRNLQRAFKEDMPCVIYDEGGDFNRRGALTQFNQMLNRIFETYRAFKVVVIICLPSFKSIDGSLLEKNIPRLLIHCEQRTMERGSFKAYSLYRMFYVLDYMKKIKVPSFAYQIVEPNFYGDFLNLPTEREKALDLLSTTSKLKEAEIAEIKLDGLISAKDLSRKLAKSLAWVSLALRDLRLKPVRKISRMSYYQEELALDALYNYNLRERKATVKGGKK